MSQHEIKELLSKARKLIENPENWLQGDFSRDAEGNPCFSTEENAVCFCSIGALRRATSSGVDNHRNYRWATPTYIAARVALQVKMGTFVDTFNDSHTHQEVLAKFDEAINSIVV